MSDTELHLFINTDLLACFLMMMIELYQKQALFSTPHPTPNPTHRQTQVATISNQELEDTLCTLHFYGHRLASQPCHLWNDFE